jgi:hypothetical protein
MTDRRERAAVAVAAYCHCIGRELPTDPQQLVDLVAEVVCDLGHLLDDHTAAPGRIGESIKKGIGLHYTADRNNLRFEQDVLLDLEQLNTNHESEE